QTTVLQLEDFTDSTTGFEAAVYPSLLVASRTTESRHHAGATAAVSVELADTRMRAAARWRAPLPQIAFDGTPGAPWIVLPPGVRRGFNLMSRAGVPLAEA